MATDTALIVIDMLNPYDHEDADVLTDNVEPILPPDGVSFLQKVRHSAFYSTALDHLLRQHSIETIVLTGQVTEQCILYTALDAYIRHFDIRVVRDAVAHIDEHLGNAAIRMMQRNMRVDVGDAADCFS